MADKTSGYGKRPIWQWIVLYIVIGLIVYGAVYFIFFHKSNSYSNQGNSSQQTQQQNPY